MALFLIADTHFGHTKMCEIQNRPKDFEQKILKNIKNIRFAKNDVVLHLGDFCLDSKNEVFWHKQFIQSFPNFVKKWLIIGNHDKKSKSWYLTHGWDFVGECIFLYAHGYNISFTHRPVLNYSLLDLGIDINIHGHTHTNDYDKRPYHIPIICENNYNLIKLRKVIENYQKRRI